MNIFEVLKSGIAILEENNIEDSGFDAGCLLEEAFGFTKNDYFLNRFNTADEDKTEKFISLINRRASGEPLQYIIGKWPFMTGEFYVGSGVLIPRADTEILVEAAAEFIRRNKDVKTVYDLCSGSGCVGISIGMMFPEVNVYCVELSDVAFSYLERNIKLNKVQNVKAIKGDITEGYEKIAVGEIDVLVSNPPYIETDEIQTLSREVRQEPFMALDGGKDGFVFYNVIKDRWIPYMKKGSFAAFECGENQAEQLKKMYSEYSDKTEIFKDLNNIERVVSFIRN
ncbi:MAG: peptide chain release factor N(5)-glutamine methyltransferase [Clostridia bacterium]|nr:peptide chain release factor N(5)-glutamine methyltransferase [Clostridia bacterium]